MKKNFFYLFALICSMSLFTACSDDDDDPVYPIEEELAGTYKGTLDIEVAGAPMATGLPKNITIAKAGNNVVTLELKDFSFMGMNLGTIKLDKCVLRQNGTSYTFTGNQELNMPNGIGKCNVAVNGTFNNGRAEANLDIQVLQLGQTVKVVYKGSKLTGSESSEAKITSFTFDTGTAANAIVTEQPVINADNTITFKVNENATAEQLKALVPTIVVSEKATYSVEGGTADFSKDVVYTVLAENGNSSQYTVKSPSRTAILKYTFDEWVVVHPGLKNEYSNPAPTNELSTSNEGAGLLATLGFKGGFPVSEEQNGYNGTSSAKLVTLYTKGAGFGMAPAITSGSLFTGAFVTNASDQLSSTRFGIPYDKKPLLFKGVYKYAPGDNYVDGSDKKNVLENLEIVDECSIMAVLYEATDADGNEIILTGHDIANSDYRVATAALVDCTAKADWTSFELPFTNLEGKTYDSSKSYKLAIVCSSSKQGAAFKGAVNSTLIVDDFEVIGE